MSDFMHGGYGHGFSVPVTVCIVVLMSLLWDGPQGVNAKKGKGQDLSTRLWKQIQNYVVSEDSPDDFIAQAKSLCQFLTSAPSNQKFIPKHIRTSSPCTMINLLNRENPEFTSTTENLRPKFLELVYGIWYNSHNSGAVYNGLTDVEPGRINTLILKGTESLEVIVLKAFLSTLSALRALKNNMPPYNLVDQITAYTNKKRNMMKTEEEPPKSDIQITDVLPEVGDSMQDRVDPPTEEPSEVTQIEKSLEIQSKEREVPKSEDVEPLPSDVAHETEPQRTTSDPSTFNAEVERYTSITISDSTLSKPQTAAIEKSNKPVIIFGNETPNPIQESDKKAGEASVTLAGKSPKKKGIPPSNSKTTPRKQMKNIILPIVCIVLMGSALILFVVLATMRWRRQQCRRQRFTAFTAMDGQEVDLGETLYPCDASFRDVNTRHPTLHGRACTVLPDVHDPHNGDYEMSRSADYRPYGKDMNFDLKGGVEFQLTPVKSKYSSLVDLEVCELGEPGKDLEIEKSHNELDLV